MASPQCLGYSGQQKVTKTICFPPKEEIIQRTTRIVKNINAKYVFVATDHDPMVQDLEQALQNLGVSFAVSKVLCTMFGILSPTLHSFSAIHQSQGPYLKHL